MIPLRVIADDLTGACDVGAELLPWPDGVAVQSIVDGGLSCGVGPRALWVRNSQSRTIGPDLAARQVATAVGEVAPGWSGVVLKKIDTGLRGQLGVEIDAAMDQLGATEAFVLPAIPEVGRTTEGGRQLIHGVPVDQTPFARDPRNPVADACVPRAIEASSRRRAGSIGLQAVRTPGALGPAFDAARVEGVTISVCDAQTDEDLTHAVEVILSRRRPLLVVGSTGLARALRRGLGLPQDVRAARAPRPRRSGGGVLAIVGSMHPTTRAQLDHAGAAGLLSTIVVDSDPEAVGVAAGAHVRAGRAVALVTAPELVIETAARLRAAALSALGRAWPTGLLLVGGETAFDVLEGLGHPPVWISGRLCPLVVRGHLLAGPYGGLPVVTKGGSTGAADLLGHIVRQLGRGSR